MSSPRRMELDRAKSRWAYRAVGLVFLGGTVGIIGNTLLHQFSMIASVLGVIIAGRIHLHRNACCPHVSIVVRLRAFAPTAGPNRARAAWWRQMNSLQKVVYLCAVTSGAIAAAVLVERDK